AVIIGLRTGRVLFSAVRNKYCSIYARASKLGKEPRFHKCYKNYGRNEPSTAMEASIIVEGFNCSVEMHGLIYACFVGDGDSNVHKTILDNNPYKDYDIMVSKKECKNHLFRNFCHHI
ncbi:GSCOCG00011338001-RA-CDS, partial [Cotesia congregata]